MTARELLRERYNLDYFEGAIPDKEAAFLTCWFWYGALYLPMPAKGLTAEETLQFYERLAYEINTCDSMDALEWVIDVLQDLYKQYGTDTLRELYACNE